MFFTDYAAAGSSRTEYVDFLIKKAIDKNLAEERYWHLLLHYRKNRFGNGYTSENDSSIFFTSPSGKTSPEAELSATIKSFFKDSASLKQNEEHPQCNFPARYKWLNSQLDFDAELLAALSCKNLDQWLTDLSPAKITMVFASHYINNPSSMYGHTLLRIDSSKKSNLLSYGVNYSVPLGNDNALAYVLKGIFGFYKGEFQVFPYYLKVQDYNNLENRDLWEFEMNFSQEQVDNLTLHLWELGATYFDYYYFQENCSYHILSLLEVANPDLHLTDGFFFSVIPGDTIKLLFSYNDLISQTRYRPSLLSQLNDKRFGFLKEEKKYFNRLAVESRLIKESRFNSLNVEKKALLLDALLDYNQFKIMKTGKWNSVSKETKEILLARNKLDYNNTQNIQLRQFSTSPALGHGSSRGGIGFGSNKLETFEEITYRPAYHDLLAIEQGYSRNSQILFFDMAFRYYNRSEKYRLERFKPIDIISLTPYDSLIPKTSWKFNLGIDSVRDSSCNYCNNLKLNFGAGHALEYGPLLLYYFLDLSSEITKSLEDSYRIGPGVSFAMLLDIKEKYKAGFAYDYRAFLFGSRLDFYTIAFSQRYSFSRNLDIRLKIFAVNNNRENQMTLNLYY